MLVFESECHPHDSSNCESSSRVCSCVESCVCVCVSAGYANEVGEAFRALVPVSAVWASYAVATAYVSADALDKGKKAAAVSLRLGFIHLCFPPWAVQIHMPHLVWRLTGRMLGRRCVWAWPWSTPSYGRLWLQSRFLDSPSTASVPRLSSCWGKPPAGHFLCASGRQPPLASPPSPSSSHPLTGGCVRECVRVSVGVCASVWVSLIHSVLMSVIRSVDYLLDSSLRKLYGEGEKPEWASSRRWPLTPNTSASLQSSAEKCLTLTINCASQRPLFACVSLYSHFFLICEVICFVLLVFRCLLQICCHFIAF